MARFDKCFQESLDKLTPEQLQDYIGSFERVYNDAKRSGRGVTEALAEAVTRGGDDLKGLNIRKLIAAKNDAELRVGIMAHIEANRGENGGMAAFLHLLHQDISGKGHAEAMTTKAEGIAQTYGNVVEQALRATDNRRLTRIFEDKKATQKLVRAILGETIDNGEIAAVAKAWQDTVEAMRVRFNTKGGAMAKMEHWLPQHHDAYRLWKFGAQKWVDFIRPLLDRRKMLTKEGDVMQREELDEFLHRAYVTLAHEGTLKEDIPGDRGFSNRGSTERQLHFAGAEAWSKYHAEFGGMSLYDMMRSQIRRMGNDIAIIETLGSKPKAMLRDVANAERERLSEREADAGERTSFAAKNAYAEKLFDYMAGNIAREPLPDWRFKIGKREFDLGDAVDSGFNFFRAVNVLKLGFATLSSIPDPAFMTAAGSFIRMSKGDLWLNLVQRMANFGDKDRVWLENAGLATDMLRNSGDRIVGEAMRDKFAATNAKVMRLSGLAAWSKAMKDAYSGTLSNMLGSMVFKYEFGKVPKLDGKIFKSYGVNLQTWNVWKMAKPEQWGRGKTLLTPTAVMNISDKALEPLALKTGKSVAELREKAASSLAGMIAHEADLSINEPSAGQRAMTQAAKNAAPGASWFINARLQFMSYPVSVAMTQGKRFMASENKMEYAAWAFGFSTLLGAMSAQVKNLAHGRDMQDMTDPTFLKAAILAGGGLGHYANLVSGLQEQYTTPAEVLLGPTGGSVDKLYDVIESLAKGDFQKMNDKLIDLGPDYVPGAKLPLAEALFKHYVMANLHEMNNPGFMERQQEKLRKRTGQEYWMGGGGENFVERRPAIAEQPEHANGN